MGEKLKNLQESMDIIAGSITKVGSYIKNPLLFIKDLLIITMPVARLAALVICGTALLIAIFGNKKGLKWIPTTVVIYMVLQILVNVL